MTGLKTGVKLQFPSLRKNDLLRGLGDAVPDVLNEEDALGDAEA